MPFAAKLTKKKAPIMAGAVSCLFLLIVIPTAQAQLPNLRVQISDTTALPGAQNTVISVFLDNYQDTVAGFNIWLQLDRNDIMEFQTDSGISIDTTWWKCLEWQGPDCVDSIMVPEDSAWDFRYIDTVDILIGSFDTTGTLVSNWEKFDARSLGIGFDINIIGVANLPAGDTTEGIPPQQGGLLCKILADVFDIPDTLQDRTVNIIIQDQALERCNFSLPDGSAIGILYDTVPDTNCWVCTLWAGDECLNWERVSVPPPEGCDSIEVDTVLSPYLDTVNVILIDGSVEVLSYVCGNVDGDPNGNVNIADLTYLVSYLFRGGPAPVPLAAGNVNCQGGDAPNVADLTWLVTYLFRGGAGPCECK